MSWWTDLKEQATVGQHDVASGALWLWNNTPLVDLSNTLVTFVSKTFTHVQEEGGALFKALRTLNTPDSPHYNNSARKVLKSMAYVVLYDVVPMVALNSLNNKMQHYFLDDYSKQQAASGYIAFVNVINLGNFLFAAYIVQRGLEASVRMTVLNSFAPAAFNANKNPTPLSMCTTELKCSTKHKMTGMTREFGIMCSNEILISGISTIPQVGKMMAQLLTIINVGRYIIRAVTPERCEDHKFMEQEFVVALGLSFALSKWLMERELHAALGPIPFFHLRVMNHVLLALHVNLAAHMHVPSADPSKATIPFDLFNLYESCSRYLIGALWGSLPNKAPKWFKSALPLSTVLKFGAGALNSDLEPERLYAIDLNTLPPKSASDKMKDLFLRPMFRSTYDFTRDPVLAPYWSDIRSGALNTFMTIETIGKKPGVALLAWSPKTAAKILDFKFGIPPNLTETILTISNEKDFWEFTRALNAWFKRHDGQREVRTTAADNLFDDDVLRPLPINDAIVDRSNKLWTQRERNIENLPESTATVQEIVAPPEQLKSERKREKVAILQNQSAKEEETVPLIQESVQDHVEVVAPAYSLFTTRKRKKPSNQCDVAQNSDDELFFGASQASLRA